MSLSEIQADEGPPALPREDNGLGRIGRVSVPVRAVEEIRRFIDANNLAPGDKLPPERVFIEQMGVSRSSLREALRILSTTGMVEVRHGDGMYVGSPSAPPNAAAKDLFAAAEEHTLWSLVEARLGVEFAAATAATERATEEDFDRLAQLLDDLQQQMQADPSYIWDPLGFELAVVETTGNSLLYEFEIRLRDAWISLSGTLRTQVGHHSEWLFEHRAILASMRARNVPQVQRLILAHVNLERFERDLQPPPNAAGG